VRAELAALAKAAIVGVLSHLPVAWWPRAGALVRRLWPGFRDA
jgi:hypothetical protein